MSEGDAVSDLDRLEAAAGECREMIREAHAATKDLRAAVREAKSELHALTREEVAAHIQLEVSRQLEELDERTRERDGSGVARTDLGRLEGVLVPGEQRAREAEAQHQGHQDQAGDPHQLPAVGAGGLFAGIVERQGAVVLTENRRQRDELERDALARVRAGVGRDYLAYAEKCERLVVSESPVTTRARLIADWWEQARNDLPCNVMLALRR